jgi:hypothetical protein
MKKEFLPYQEALELKELGFNEKCAAHYLDVDDLELKWLIYRNLSIDINKCIQAPLFQQAFRFFREKYELTSWVYNSDKDNYFYSILQNGRIIKAHKDFMAYEEAELACLKNLIEIAKTK